MVFRKKKNKAKYRKTKQNRISLSPLTNYTFLEPKNVDLKQPQASALLNDLQNEILLETRENQRNELIELIKKTLKKINCISDKEKMQFLKDIENAEIETLIKFYKKLNETLIAETVFIDSLIS